MTSLMQAAVYRRLGVVEVDALAVPALGDGDVLIEVAWCGVCGSDLHFFLDGWARPGTVGGHEWSGRVVAVGSGVDEWKVGDPVVGGPSPTCGACPSCLARRPNLCIERATPGIEESHGGFATYVRADARSLVAVPDSLDLRTAALAEPLAVALHAVNQSGVTAGQRAFVAGAGPIGALVIAALRARGVDDIVVSEPGGLRRDMAERLGATRVVTPDDLDVPTVVEPRRVVDGAAHVAFECSGKGAAMTAALTQLLPMGTLVLVGAGMDSAVFDANRILLNEVVITGSFEYDATGIADAVALLASGAVDTASLIEPSDVPLTGLLDAMRALAAGDVAGKVLVRPDRAAAVTT